MKFISIILSFVFFITLSNATEILVSNKDIKYKGIVNYDDLYLSTTNKKIRCIKFQKYKLLENKYQAKHYILKGKAICNKDVQIAKNHKIRYDFGNIVIEKSGKVIGENKKFIKIKNPDGSIDKIYKNGQTNGRLK